MRRRLQPPRAEMHQHRNKRKKKCPFESVNMHGQEEKLKTCEWKEVNTNMATHLQSSSDITPIFESWEDYQRNTR